MPKLKEVIGRNIKRYREGKGLSKVELADLLDTTYQSLIKYESGATLPSEPTIEKLAKAFNIEESDLASLNQREEGPMSKPSVLQAIKIVHDALLEADGGKLASEIFVSDLTELKPSAERKKNRKKS